MKNVFRATIAAFVAALALAACGGAEAANVSQTYTSTNGIVFTTERVRRIEFLPAEGVIRMVMDDGTAFYPVLNDNGVVFNNIKINNPAWLTVGANVMYDPSKAAYIRCVNGTSVLSWNQTSATTQYFNDACALYTQATSKTN